MRRASDKFFPRSKVRGLVIELEQTNAGVILPVRAQPGGRKNAITGEHHGQLKVSVTAAPEKGKANQALIRVLADELGLKRSQITLISGETATQKKFLCEGIDLEELRGRLASLLAAE